MESVVLLQLNYELPRTLHRSIAILLLFSLLFEFNSSNRPQHIIHVAYTMQNTKKPMHRILAYQNAGVSLSLVLKLQIAIL